MRKLLNLLCVISLSGLVHTAQAAIQVEMELNNNEIQVGDVFNVTVNAKGLSSIDGGGFNIVFDTDKLRLINTSMNDTDWEFKTYQGDMDVENGKLRDVMFASFNGVSGEVNLATLQFEALETGYSGIALEASSKSPFASQSQKVDSQYSSSSVNISGSDNEAAASVGAMGLLLYIPVLIAAFFKRKAE